MKTGSESTQKDRLADLPEDVEALRALVVELSGELTGASLLIEKLKLQIARLKRVAFTSGSERARRELDQMELALEELEAEEAAAPAPVALARERSRRPARRPLPDHLPRETVTHEPAPAGEDGGCPCPSCGGALRRLGEDVVEVLEHVPESWKVVRHVRPKLACRSCEAIVQAPARGLLARRLRHGPRMLARTLVAKYSDHLPLHRQSEMIARAGIEIDRSTLADGVGHAHRVLAPLVELIEAEVMASPVLHADDTPVPVLAPGAGRTKTGRLWVYVRDERPHDGGRPPAALCLYGPDRKAERPRAHLAAFAGRLHADGYAGFAELYQPGRKPGPIVEVACWAHVRRKFFDLHAAGGSPIAGEAVERIGALYAVEAEVRGQPPDVRLAARRARSRPLVDDLRSWLDRQLARVPRQGELARAIRYALSRWEALSRHLDDGTLEIDNNAAERAIRGLALGRKNWLFAGSDAGGERAAAMHTLVESAKLNGVDPQAWLADVLDRIDDHPNRRLHELLPWNWKTARAFKPQASRARAA